MKFKQEGFTLIELIIVIAIIALLAAATFVAVNPAKRIGDANNAQRWSDISALADAWQTYTADNTGSVVITADSGVTYAIATTTGGTWTSSSCDDNTGATTTSDLLSLGGLITAGYIGTVPLDPTITGVDRTGYYLYTDDTGVLKIGACVTYEASTAANAVIEVIR